MTTKDTPTLLREVEAALEFIVGHHSDNQKLRQTHVPMRQAARQSLPTIQELIRRASVAPSADENTCPQCAYKMMRNMCVAYGIEPDKFLQKPLPAPVPVASEWMSPDLEWALECIDGNLSPDIGQTIRKYLGIPQPPQAPVASGWMPIESAPKDGTIFFAMQSQDYDSDDLQGEKQGWLSLPRHPYLCRWDRAYYVDESPSDAGEWVEVDKWGKEYSDYKPAYWMPIQPLPQPPQAKGAGDE